MSRAPDVLFSSKKERKRTEQINAFDVHELKGSKLSHSSHDRARPFLPGQGSGLPHQHFVRRKGQRLVSRDHDGHIEDRIVESIIETDAIYGRLEIIAHADQLPIVCSSENTTGALNNELIQVCAARKLSKTLENVL